MSEYNREKKENRNENNNNNNNSNKTEPKDIIQCQRAIPP